MRLGGLLDLVYPRFCLSCDAGLLGTGWTWLCSACLARIDPASPSSCPVCAGELGPGAPASSCPDCRRLRPRFDATVVAGRYNGLLRELVSRLKYGREPALAYPLGELLAQTLDRWDGAPRPDLVVPVPLGWSRRLRRGFNQSGLVAAEVARRMGLPLSGLALRRCSGGPAQASLSRTARLSGPRGTMGARDLRRSLEPLLSRLPPFLGRVVARSLPAPARGRVVLLVDDVLTTVRTSVRPKRPYGSPSSCRAPSRGVWGKASPRPRVPGVA
jgi:predicted amidophosphoribosyltransferase